MQELIVKYNRAKDPLIFDLVLPGTWEELNERNILYIGHYWQSWQMMLRDGLSMRTAKGKLFLELTGFTDRKKLKDLCEALSNLKENSNVNILGMTNFVFDEFKLTKNLIPEIKINKLLKYCGPADRLGDISIDEFSFAFACYTAWHKTNKEEYLDKLAGTLYRPWNANYDTDGEIKLPFNNKLIEKYAAMFSVLPDGYKNAIYLFFKGCLDSLVKRFPQVFNTDNKSKSGGSFNETIVMMSGAEFGDYNQTKRENLYVVLTRLQQLIIQSKKTPTK